MASSKRKLKPAATIGIIVGIVVLIIIAGIITPLSHRMPKNPPGTIGNTSGNLNNKGLFVEDGDTIYFINPYDHNSIYKMNLDGSRAEPFVNVSASYLNSAGDYLYFNQQDAGGGTAFGLAGSLHGVYRKKKTGSKEVNGIDRAVVGVMVLIDNTLYYQYGDDDGTTFHCADIDGKNRREINKDFINPSCVIGGQIYYPDFNNLHYLSVLNTVSGYPQVYIRERVHIPTYQDNYIYYLSVDNDYALYRYSIPSNTIERITEDRVDTFNIIGDHIYYQKNSTSEPALYRIRTDGTNKEMVASGNYTNINTTSYYTYFQDFLDEGSLYRVANGEGSTAEKFIP
ncbi:MAG: DUF5050 domain-containing protein [Lachnospiraceae bacterium]|nr:DUF5050 domain-containing protein [Lachnospiraceae bacterium]